MGSDDADDVWLLTGNRFGEIAQQRTLATALGRPWREMAVARMVPAGKGVDFDFAALQPPWPRLAISFGKTLEAVRHMRAMGATATRYVHLGLPRKMPVDALDLIVPMPTDRYVDAPNVMRLRMPFNQAPAPLAPDSALLRRLLAQAWPRPWTALIIGGPTTRGALSPARARDIVVEADSRARRQGGSLLISTSPRTPPDVFRLLPGLVTAPGEVHLFSREAPQDNPYAAYLQLADELVVTGDSASMIAECWRTGHPLWVASLAQTPRQRAMRGLRALVPASLVASGRVSADVDIARWVRRLANEGTIGLWGRSDPVRSYSASEDDDLARVVARVEAMLSAPAGRV